MFLNLSRKKQAVILCIKMAEIDDSPDYSPKDKFQMKQFYRAKLKIANLIANF
ncbi:MAG: hypothetical protein H7Y10_12110 [Flavobacterium sp.]|nr:hypothetical protein [Flavobacterium sp.]